MWRQTDRRQVAPEPPGRAAPVRVTRVGVVEPDELQPLVAELDDRVHIVEHLGAGASQDPTDRVGARPVIVVAEHAEHRRLEAADDVAELLEERLAVAHEVARDAHDVGAPVVDHLNGRHLHAHGRDAADVHVGHVRDPERRRQALGVALGAREPPQLDIRAGVEPGRSKTAGARTPEAGRERRLRTFGRAKNGHLTASIVDTARITMFDGLRIRV